MILSVIKKILLTIVIILAGLLCVLGLVVNVVSAGASVLMSVMFDALMQLASFLTGEQI